jgi:hypothetical protein
MQSVSATTDAQNGLRRPRSLAEATGGIRNMRRTTEYVLRDQLPAFDLKRYDRDQVEAAKEHEIVRKLGHEVINLGYKVLATKMHPDRPGGSTEAFQRLQPARRLVREAF